jgi:hypothetical protein
MVLLSYLQELIGSLKSLGSHITVEMICFKEKKSPKHHAEKYS